VACERGALSGSLGDARAYDGTVSIIQPLIAPLYDGRSMHEFVDLLSGHSEASGYEIVRDYWQKQHPGADFETWWRRALHEGWIEGSELTPKSVGVKIGNVPLRGGTDDGAMEINFRRDPSIWTANSPTTAGCRNCRSR